MDARDFIRNVVKKQMLEIWVENIFKVENAHIVMNLPALAITFIDVFQGLFKDCQHLRSKAQVLPKVYVYGFSKSETPEIDIQERCEKYLGAKLDANHLDGVFFVRNVAPNKDMMRASFLLPEEVLFDLDVPESNKENDDERSGVKRAGSPDSSESLKKR